MFAVANGIPRAHHTHASWCVMRIYYAEIIRHYVVKPLQRQPAICQNITANLDHARDWMVSSLLYLLWTENQTMNRISHSNGWNLISFIYSSWKGKAINVQDQDRSGKYLTEERQILNWWTEYCSELYNYKASGYPSVLNCPQTDTGDDHPIVCKELEAAVQSLKKGKSAGVDNIPEELVQAGGADVITALTTICNKIWQTGEWPTPWTPSLVITSPKKGTMQQCQNYRTISLISHPSSHKRRRSSLTNRQASGQEGAPQIFNLRIVCEKYLQHQQDLYHVLIDFEMAIDRVGMQLCGQPWINRTSAPTLSESPETAMTRPLMQSSSTAA